MIIWRKGFDVRGEDFPYQRGRIGNVAVNALGGGEQHQGARLEQRGDDGGGLVVIDALHHLLAVAAPAATAPSCGFPRR